MFLYKIAQEKLLNIILLLSSVIVWHIVTNNLTSAGYEIVKNISYSVIASIIFYYINSVYVSVKKDKLARTYLINNFKSVQDDIYIYIQLCMPDRDRANKHLRSKDLENPVFFRNYFKYSRDGHSGMAAWSSYPLYQDTEVENIQKMVFAICQFYELFRKYQHDLFLSNEAQDYFNLLGRDINDHKNVSYMAFILIREITEASSWHLDRNYPEAPHLYYLRQKNYTVEKYKYIKLYVISAYVLFWIAFALDTIA